MIAIALALAIVAAAPQPAAPAPATARLASAPVGDPARKAPAERIAARLLPPGVFATMMKSTIDMVSTSMSGQMFDMPVRDFVKMAGLPEADGAKLGPATIKQVMTIMDPAFEERQRITMQVMGVEMSALMTAMEPEYRAGLAEALAGRFDPQQLAEIDRFFATPAGAAYAGQSMLLYVDPAMMSRMQTMMPRLMQAMPAIMQKVTAATAALPKLRDAKSLTAAEQAQLEALFGPAS